MSDEETRQKRNDESESEDSDDDVEDVPKIDVDPSTLTPLSPEVISKQVRALFASQNWSLQRRMRRQRSTWVGRLGAYFR